MCIGLYSNRMHDYVVLELELGRRAAMAQDSEDCGRSALMDLSYDVYVLREMKKRR